MIEQITQLDFLVSQQMDLLRTPIGDEIFLWITRIGDPISLTTLSVVLVLVLAYQKRWKDSIMVSVGMVFGLLAENLIKIIVERARPENSLILMEDFSFPSGHTTMTTLFFLLLLFVWKGKIRNPLRRRVYVVSCLLLPLLIGFSRVYLNAHWLSDVLTGFLLGGIIFLILITVFQSGKEKIS